MHVCWQDISINKNSDVCVLRGHMCEWERSEGKLHLWRGRTLGVHLNMLPSSRGRNLRELDIFRVVPWKKSYSAFVLINWSLCPLTLSSVTTDWTFNQSKICLYMFKTESALQKYATPWKSSQFSQFQMILTHIFPISMFYCNRWCSSTFPKAK